jgi:hypothetical protein
MFCSSYPKVQLLVGRAFKKKMTKEHSSSKFSTAAASQSTCPQLWTSWKYGLFPCFIVIFFVSCVLLIYLFFGNSSIRMQYSENSKVQIVLGPSTALYEDGKGHLFPHLVHQMWKTKDSLTSDANRWIGGCKKVNSDYLFRLYDDNDLKLFTHQHYPEYSELFDSLTGVCK